MNDQQPSGTDLPPGFRILNDGPGREVLVDDRTDDPAPVFQTREEAASTAWTWWREMYDTETSTDPPPTRIYPNAKNPAFRDGLWVGASIVVLIWFLHDLVVAL